MTPTHAQRGIASSRARACLRLLAVALVAASVSFAQTTPPKKKPAARPGTAQTTHRPSTGPSTSKTTKKPAAKSQAHAGTSHAATSHAAPHTTSKAHKTAAHTATHAPVHNSAQALAYGRAVTESTAARGTESTAAPAPQTRIVPENPIAPQLPYGASAVPEGQEAVPMGAQLPASEALAEPSAANFLYPRQLDKFFHALAQLPPPSQVVSAVPTEPTTTTATSFNNPLGATVRILQFGDSHTAADIFTGEMRAQLQPHFGDGGLGYQYPGHPFAGYRLAGSTRSQSRGWVTQGNHFTQLGDAETGLGGIAISTSRPGETVTLETSCQTLEVQFLRQAGGGRMRLSDNGNFVAEIATASPDSSTTDSAGTTTYSCTPGLHDFELTTLDAAPVRLLGLVTEQPGVTYECLGINGAVAPLILRWNQHLFGDYLIERSPNLIVLAYGTNESMQSESHNEDYVAELRRVVRLLHSLVPEASILMLGPYDHALKSGRGRHAAWHTAPAIDRIIADQKAVCRTEGCAFYDERARQGGPGVMARWAAEGLAQPDHTHLTGTGYRVLADALYRDLMALYNSYLQTARR